LISEERKYLKSVTTREGNEPFVFFAPSANGFTGIHHVMARAIKDIFADTKLKRVPSEACWLGYHGLPRIRY
jgi:isoleucyl-tRNA synthetase